MLATTLHLTHINLQRAAMSPSSYSAYRLDQRTSFDDLTLVSLPLVQPGPDEVLVKLHAGSLQFRDLYVCD